MVLKLNSPCLSIKHWRTIYLLTVAEVHLQSIIPCSSPIVNDQSLNIKAVKFLMTDWSYDWWLTISVNIICTIEPEWYSLRRWSATPSPVGLLHSTNIAEGAKLNANEYPPKRTVVAKPIKTTTATTKPATKLPYAEVEPLLAKNTCTVCHNVTKRKVICLPWMLPNANTQ